MNLKQQIRRLPVIGDLLARAYVKLAARRFNDSSEYWEERYARGGNSGDGSYGELAAFKAEFLNRMIEQQEIRSVIEFGSGDGNQLKLAEYPSYLGVDVSSTAIAQCRRTFRDDPSKKFLLLSDYTGKTAELALSLDVIYHLVEDAVFESHMRDLFDAAERFVVVYASNTDRQDRIQSPHVRHRCFTEWVARERPDWKLVDTIKNPMSYNPKTGAGSFADFYVFASRVIDQLNYGR